MPTGDKSGFIPKRQEREHNFLGLPWPASMFTYYSWARLIGYWAQTGQNPATQWIEKKIVRQNLNGIPSHKTRKYWGLIEAAAFTLVASIGFFVEKKHLKKNIYDAIAAERSTNPDDTNIFSLYKSNNPFVRSLRERFSLQQATRFPAALAFAANVVLGVFLVTLNYTLERSMFIENNAYDLLQNLIYEVQKLKVSGDRDKERLYTGLQRALQRTLKDNHRPMFTDAQLNANEKVFERLTNHILKDNFHVPEAVYILGEMANHPDRVQKLLTDIDKIEQAGDLRTFALHKAMLAKNPAGRKAPQPRSFLQMAATPTPQTGIA